MHSSIQVAIIGATGYTGEELLRLLFQHPYAEIAAVTSQQHVGKPISSFYPQFSRLTHLSFEDLAVEKISQNTELVFLCLPHHESAKIAAQFLEKGLKVVDLSADFRLHDLKVYEKFYGPHQAPAWLKQAVYGIPEFFKEKIKSAQLIANPGCYPTSILLALAPLLKAKLIHTQGIICDSKSGMSGAGRNTVEEILQKEMRQNFKAYKVGTHRHTPEIEQGLSILAGEPIKVTFTPHLLPVMRGILSTIYCKTKGQVTLSALQNAFKDFYQHSPFVQLLENQESPRLHDVQMTNLCQIALHFDPNLQQITLLSAIDNLTKGASGQAIQNMNLLCNFPETSGLLPS
ncbi:MAG: N-acetyl-gamma-glutamyl-phosphate reductase [Deltaproteobacteria bacterium]|nr:N-acetyl-gamma-glutamyl-phosphate reductase [Deltaproteobacteria bacterium]